MRVLLVEPEYKQAKRTKHEAKLCPVGLFKHYFFHKNNGDDVYLVKGCVSVATEPDLIKITSLYTYWSDDVLRTIEYYKEMFPHAAIKVGGIFASLMPDIVSAKGVIVHKGIDKEVEHIPIDWNYLNRTVQILHTSRSCIRNCHFCGVRQIEPEISYERWSDIKNKIQLKDIVFFDNNFLANPYHKEILEGIAGYRINGKVIRCEAQSGFDPRLITLDDAILLKKARFKNIRISWDHGLKQGNVVKIALAYLIQAGFNSKNIGVFMLYNWAYPFQLLEEKRKICFNWNVQIFDCRFRPLNQLFDNYEPYANEQTSSDYFIHPNWTDAQVRQFRRNVRRQNIMIRFNFRTERQMDDWINHKKKTGKLKNRKLTL